MMCNCWKYAGQNVCISQKRAFRAGAGQGSSTSKRTKLGDGLLPGLMGEHGIDESQKEESCLAKANDEKREIECGSIV